ncbi:Bacillolysin precursor [Chryseobacterium oranimense G311]|nr:Bacillolysin precursor [Chryseobacterium oranimense G311]
MEKAHDYYVNRHNRNSYDGSGSIIRNYYNINFNRNTTTGAGQTPIDGTNAAAIDQQGIVAMVYGSGLYQGQAGYFGPIVGIDVAGHEYSHLMVSRTANLAYQAESGA